MSKSMFREIIEGEDVTDIVAKAIVFITIPVAVFVVAISVWTALLH